MTKNFIYDYLVLTSPYYYCLTNMTKNRVKIINRAKKLFHKKGFSHTSVDQIIAESNVSKSNFYYHFKTKDDLGLEILNLRIEEFRSGVIRSILLDTNHSAVYRISGLYDAFIEFHNDLNCKRGCPFGNLALEMSDLSEGFRQSLHSFFDEWIDALSLCIRQGVENGEFSNEIDPRDLAEFIFSHIEGAILLLKTQKTIGPLQNGKSTVLRLLNNL